MTNSPLTKQTRIPLLSPSRQTVVQIPRALAVSVLAAGIDVLGLILLVEKGGCDPWIAATISYLLGGLVQYIMCARWVFSTMPAHAVRTFLLFILLSLVGLAITGGVVWLLNGQWHLRYLAAKGIALGLAFVWNFTSRKWLIFQPSGVASPPTPASL